MVILCIDTSSVYASCAVMRDGVILAEKAVLSGLVHSKSVMKLVEDCLEGVSIDIAEVDVFGCVAGPGSFTGVRIGVCAVKGLAQALNKPCYAADTLVTLSKNLITEGLVCPIMDARRGQVYSAVFENGEMIRESDVCPIEEVLQFIGARKCIFLGDGVKAFKEKIINTLGENAIFAPAQHNFTRAASACEEALLASEEGRLVTAAALDAIYLRKPQAEREYEGRNTQP